MLFSFDQKQTTRQSSFHTDDLNDNHLKNGLEFDSAVL